MVTAFSSTITYYKKKNSFGMKNVRSKNGAEKRRKQDGDHHYDH